MAAGTKLIFRFGTASGEKNFTFNYGDDSAATSDIKEAMQTMIANGSIYKYPPLTAVSAKAQITTETEWDLSD